MKEDLENRLFKALETTPALYQEKDLSDSIIKKIQSGERAEQRRIALLFIATISVFLLLSMIGLTYFLGVERIKEMQNILISGSIIGGLVLLIQILDYGLVRGRKKIIFSS